MRHCIIIKKFHERKFQTNTEILHPMPENVQEGLNNNFNQANINYADCVFFCASFKNRINNLEGFMNQKCNFLFMFPKLLSGHDVINKFVLKGTSSMVVIVAQRNKY